MDEERIGMRQVNPSLHSGNIAGGRCTSRDGPDMDLVEVWRQDPSGGAGKHCFGEGCVGPAPDQQKKTGVCTLWVFFGFCSHPPVDTGGSAL